MANDKTRKIFRGVLLAGGLLLGEVSAFAVDGPGARDLVLSLDTGKAKFVLHEPVIVTYELHNPTGAPIRSEARMEFVEQRMQLYVQEGDGPPVRYYSGVMPLALGRSMTLHEPGGSLVGEAILFNNDLQRAPAFPRVGRYSISGRMFLGYHPNAVYAEADPVEVEIVEPDPIDQQMGDALGSEADLIRLLDLERGGTQRYCRDRDEVACFEHMLFLVNQYPKSAYAPIMAFSLAEWTGTQGASGEKDYVRKIEILQGFLSQWPDHAFAPRAEGRLAYVLHMAGREAEAATRTAQFEQKYPGRRSPRRLIEESDRSRR